MTESKHPHAHALQVAQKLVDLLRPHCDWIEIAGSVRRGKPEVKDIELTLIPRPTLLPFMDKQVQVGVFTKAEYGDAKSHRWGEKYRGIVFEGMRCEIFMCDLYNRGWIYFLRTGPGDMNTALVTRIKHLAPFKVEEGYIWDKRGHKLRISTEQDWFDLLHIPFIEPDKRDTVMQHFKPGHYWSNYERFLMTHTLTILTAQMAVSDPDAVDITAGSGLGGPGECLAPLKEMVYGHKAGNGDERFQGYPPLSDDEYTARYLALLRERYSRDSSTFRNLLERERLVLKCYCAEGQFCHRLLAAEVLQKIGASMNIEVILAGELQPEVQQMSLFDMPTKQVKYD
jgi:uncharacterized protein YeaO (DUF488 family)